MKGIVTKHEARIKSIEEMLRTKFIDLPTALKLVGDEYLRVVLANQGKSTAGIDLDFEFVCEWGTYPEVKEEYVLIH